MIPKCLQLVYMWSLIGVMIVLLTFQVLVRKNVVFHDLTRNTVLFSLGDSVTSQNSQVKGLETIPCFNHTNSSLSWEQRVKGVELTRIIRNQTLQALCKVNEATDVRNLTANERYTLSRQIIVDDERQVMFCFVPKVACSNWKRVFKILGGTLGPLSTNDKMDHHNGIIFLKDMDENLARLKVLTYYKFMFVRHPFERLLSAYRNKFGENIGDFRRKYSPKIIQKYRPRPQADEAIARGNLEITFEEYIRFLIDQETRYMDPHWKPMHELCQPCAIGYDFIGSFENLKEDAEYVLSKIRGNSTVSFPIRQSYYKPTTHEKLMEEFSHVHPRFIAQLIDKYILDFILFGYTPPRVVT